MSAFADRSGGVGVPRGTRSLVGRGRRSGAGRRRCWGWVLPLSRTRRGSTGATRAAVWERGPGGEGPARGRRTGPLPLREGCAPAGPRPRSRTAQQYRAGMRRGLGAVGNGWFVAYGARSPAPACGGHAQTPPFIPSIRITARPSPPPTRPGHPGGSRRGRGCRCRGRCARPRGRPGTPPARPSRTAPARAPPRAPRGR